MKNTIVITALAFTLFASCKKSDKNATKSQQLASGKWHFKSFTDHQTLPVTTEYDYTPNLKPCAKDESYEFQGDGDFIWDNGVKCDPNSLQTITGTWKLVEGDSKVIMSIANTSLADTMVVDKIDGSTLVLTRPYYLVEDGVTYKGSFRYTYNH